MEYKADKNRYDKMIYRRCGNSGLKLPAVSLGLWHNFGNVDDFETSREIVLNAFDLGITHFDLANNYGPPPGSAETNFGKIIKSDLKRYRDEIIVSTKAGYTMWDGPYGDWGSRKYLIASLDQSLKRMGLEYVDIFYHHRFDPETPMEESLAALDQIVRQGKALYVGISKYSTEQTEAAYRILRDMGTPFIIFQPSYNMFNRVIENNGLLNLLEEKGLGCITFSPLAQGMLTGKYIKGIPENSRAAKPHGFLKPEQITEDKIGKVLALKEIADGRGQTLSQMALAWILRLKSITSVLVGASSVKQIKENRGAIDNLNFSDDELNMIELILK
jgi:L-glyceraldehyde 3-phosphate reductase